MVFGKEGHTLSDFKLIFFGPNLAPIGFFAFRMSIRLYL